MTELSSAAGHPTYQAVAAYRALGRSLYEKADDFYKIKDFAGMLDCDLALLYTWAHGLPSIDFSKGWHNIGVKVAKAPLKLPSGLVGRAAQGVNYLRLTEADILPRFLEVSRPVYNGFVHFIPLQKPEQAWPQVWEEMRRAIESGTTRKPRRQIEQ